MGDQPLFVRTILCKQDSARRQPEVFLLRRPHETRRGLRFQTIDHLGIAGELLRFFWQRKWWWLSPMILMLLFLAALMIFAQSSAVAPFIYTLF